MNIAKILGLVLAAVVVLNFAGLLFKLINLQTFWLVVIVSAIVAYLILPRLKK